MCTDNGLTGGNMPLRTTLENFLNHVDTLEAKRRQGDDLYEKEFQQLKALNESLRGLSQYTCSCGENEYNRKKNRYKDILPYDYTRVVLSEIEGIPGSDYINASYIKGASGSRAYIASQGPLPQTVDDFWRMIWDCEVQVIVMASSEVEAGKQKCERYWVGEQEERSFGNLKLKLVRMKKVCTDFAVRTMKLCSQNEERTIIQFHYVTWPDHGIPDSVTPILSMVRLIRDCQASETLPVLVHCSAGCGRTGTLCAIDYVWGLLRSGKLNEDFNLFQLISDMRRQRIAMVQTKEQYILVHLAVKELFQQHLTIIDDHPYENVDFSGFPLGSMKELLDESDEVAVEASTNEEASKNEEVITNVDTSTISHLNGLEEVPLLLEKKNSDVECETLEGGVKQLIQTWNNGRPSLLGDRTGESCEDISSKKFTDHCDIGIHRGSSQSIAKSDVVVRERSGRSSSPSGSEDTLPSSDKVATVVRKPSIARLRAIFEKPSASDDSEKSDSSSTRPSPDNRNLPVKRNRSPFKKQIDSPEVIARYQDTALKVYSEIRHSEEQEKSEKVVGETSPVLPEFLRRGSSRQNVRNISSIWYDAEESLLNEETQKTEDKPTLPVKRSKSLKVQSITENAFGLFKLSPLRHRKNSVAAYLGVEEERRNAFRDTTSKEKDDAEPKAESERPAKLSSPRVYKRVVQKPDGSKEKSRLRYLLGENPTIVVPGFSGTSVQLVHLKNNIAEEDINKNVCSPADVETDDDKDVSAAFTCVAIGDSTLSSGDLPANEGDTSVSATIILPSKVPSSDASGTTNGTVDDEKLKLPLLTKDEFEDDKPPPLPLKMNSPRNSPMVRRHNVDVTTKADLASNDKGDSDNNSPPLPPKVNGPRNSPMVQRHHANRSVQDEASERKDEVDRDNGETARSVETKLPAKDRALVGEDEECQRMIRDCQEYLLSSGYSNVFLAMEKNMTFIEESLKKHPRGGFVDALSGEENDGVDSGNDGKAVDVHEGSPCSVYNNVFDAAEGENCKRESENVPTSASNEALDEVLVTCKEYSDVNESLMFARQYSFDEKTMDIEDCSMIDDVENVEDKVETVDDELQRIGTPKFTKKSDYELLWLSESGTSTILSGLEKSTTEEMAPETSSFLEPEFSNATFKTEDSKFEEIVVLENSAFAATKLEILECDETKPEIPKSEETLKRKNTDAEIFNSTLENVTSDLKLCDDLSALSVNDSHVPDDTQCTLDGDVDGDCVGIKVETSCAETSANAVSTNAAPEVKSDETWDLSAYKIVQKLMQNQNNKQSDEKIYENVSSHKLYEAPTSENDFIKRAMFADGPPKPPRTYVDHKNRKPQPLPRTIRPSKADATKQKRDSPVMTNGESQMSPKFDDVKDTDQDLYSFPVKRQVTCRSRKVNHVYEELNLPPADENEYAEVRPVDVPKRTKKRSERFNTSTSVGHHYENCTVDSKRRSKTCVASFLVERSPTKDGSADDHVYESIDLTGRPVENESPLPKTNSYESIPVPTLESQSKFDGGSNHVDDNDDHTYVEVDKWKHKKWTRCLVEPSNSDETSCVNYSKDDLELQPVAPPRKRQSSTMSRSLSEEVGGDPFWWTHTLPVRLSGSSQDQFIKQMSEWGEEWDSEDDCLPPVPAKTKEAYMLPNDSASSSSKSELSLRETSPQAGGEASELKPSRSFSKFNILTKLGLKSENKTDVTSSIAKTTKPGAYLQTHGLMQGEALNFPNRLAKRPKGPRNPPSNWVITAPTSS